MKILLPIDGSKHSLKACDYIIKHLNMFNADGVPLVVLNVQTDNIPPEVMQYIPPKSIAKWYDSQAEMSLKAGVAKLKKAGVTFEVAKKTGHISDTILEQAKKMKADLIVMGSHGRGALMNLFMGSIATQVLAQAKQPVLIIR